MFCVKLICFPLPFCNTNVIYTKKIGVANTSGNNDYFNIFSKFIFV